MKTALFLAGLLVLASSLQAQVPSARRLTRRITGPQQPAGQPPAPQPAPVAPVEAAATPNRPTNPQSVPPSGVRALPRPSSSAASAPRAVPLVRPQPPKEQTAQKIVEFQKRRAAQGSATAQYDLAIRYLKGDGVELDEQKGRELLESAAKNGHSQAKKKLDEFKASKR